MARLLPVAAAIVLMAVHLSARRGAEPLPAPAVSLAQPPVDETRLNPEQRARWVAVRSQLTIVSARVDEALVLLDELSMRLHARGLVLNARDAGTAQRMEQSLEQSRALIAALEFERAAEALRRTDYERTKLKHVTGQ